MSKQAKSGGGKLSRENIKEILEANAELYKEDQKLVGYIVDLALYLLEFEYDWKDSVADPPPFKMGNLVASAERPDAPAAGRPSAPARAPGTPGTPGGTPPGAGSGPGRTDRGNPVVQAPKFIAQKGSPIPGAPPPGEGTGRFRVGDLSSLARVPLGEKSAMARKADQAAKEAEKAKTEKPKPEIQIDVGNVKSLKPVGGKAPLRHTASLTPGTYPCPHCGGEIPVEVRTCPSCHNMAR